MGLLGKRLVLVGLGMALLVGLFLVYFRLWFMDYSVSSDETELLRRQFDLANRDAMDESAEWRMRYDTEVDRLSKCTQELSRVKDSYQRMGDDSVINTVDLLRKENKDLLQRIESLEQKNAALKSKCLS